jgi:hypothetical protein
MKLTRQSFKNLDTTTCCSVREVVQVFDPVDDWSRSPVSAISTIFFAMTSVNSPDGQTVEVQQGRLLSLCNKIPPRAPPWAGPLNRIRYWGESDLAAILPQYVPCRAVFAFSIG